MYTKHSPIHDCGESEKIKNTAAVFPHIWVPVFILALVIEAVHLSDLSALMVATKQSDLVGISLIVIISKAIPSL